MAGTRQQTGTDRCAKCRKPFFPGDRVQMAYIIEKAGHLNPKAPFEGGSMLSPDFELAHISCVDPGLDRGIIALSE